MDDPIGSSISELRTLPTIPKYVCHIRCKKVSVIFFLYEIEYGMCRKYVENKYIFYCIQYREDMHDEFLTFIMVLYCYLFTPYTCNRQYHVAST